MADRNRIIELRQQGKTLQEIGDEVGISRQRVHQLITGYKSSCKRKGQKEYQREYVKRPYQIIKRYNTRKERKSKVLTHYGNGKLACVKCGFNDIRALSIDHINSDGYKHRLTRIHGGMYNWLIKNNYPTGFQTLCMNCQWVKRFEKGEHRK